MGFYTKGRSTAAGNRQESGSESRVEIHNDIAWPHFKECAVSLLRNQTIAFRVKEEYSSNW